MPLVWLALGFVLGVYLSRTWDVPPAAVALLLTSVAGGFLLWRSWGLRSALPWLLVAGALLGLARGGPHLLDPPGDLDRHHGSAAQVRGVVRSLPELFGERVRFEMAVEAVRPRNGGWTAAEGALLVRVPPLPEVAYGDRLLVEGVIEAPQPFSGFDYPQHLASQGIGSLMRNAQVAAVEDRGGGQAWLRQLHRVRGGAARSLAETLPEPQASLTQALLLGLRGGVPEEVSDAFRRSGTAHLLAISGLHVGVVLALGLGAAHWLLGRRRRAYLLLPLALIWGYALLAGAPPSAVRASLMGTVFLLALATGRGASPLNALAMAALLMVAWQPRWLWHLSFQLSFAAMAGVVLLGLPAWSKLREVTARRGDAGPWRTRLWYGVGGGLLVSAGAVIGTLPLVAFNFHQLPLLGIPTTLVTLPVLPGILVGGLATAALAALWAPLGWAVGWGPWLLGEYLELVVHGAARVSWSVVKVGEVGPALVWGYYALLAGVLAVLLRRRWLPEAGRITGALWRGPAGPRHRLGVLIAVGLLTVALWAAALARPDGRLHLYVLDVGQGDAILVRTPGGHNVLMDGTVLSTASHSRGR